VEVVGPDGYVPVDVRHGSEQFGGTAQRCAGPVDRGVRQRQIAIEQFKLGFEAIEIVPNDNADKIRLHVREQLGWIGPKVAPVQELEPTAPIRSSFGQRGAVPVVAKTRPNSAR
jgi:hypothetical protein